jgi:hypothetical protein
MKPSIAILIPYFGDWPVWIDFFIESCRWNSDIDWILFNEHPPPENRARNVRHVTVSFDEYKDIASDALGLQLTGEDFYKLCDLKPALAYVHRDFVSDYDFVGFGDLDVIYGDIRAFYDDELLHEYDILSSHRDRISGHLCLMRNTEEMITAFQRIRGWKIALSRPEHVEFDEGAFFRMFKGRRAKLLGRLGYHQPALLFREAYSTPAPSTHMRWFWERGNLTNEFYPEHPFMYLHFMSWHSNRWYASQEYVDSDSLAPWSRLDRIVKMDWRDARRNGFMISPEGIEPIERRTYR